MSALLILLAAAVLLLPGCFLWIHFRSWRKHIRDLNQIGQPCPHCTDNEDDYEDEFYCPSCGKILP